MTSTKPHDQSPSRLIARIIGAGLCLPSAAAFLIIAGTAGVPATTAIGRSVLGGVIVFVVTAWGASWLLGSIRVAGSKTQDRGSETP